MTTPGRGDARQEPRAEPAREPGRPGIPQIPGEPAREPGRPGIPQIPGTPPWLLAWSEFVIVDVETTGWLPEEAGITEIGAVRVSAGQLLGEFSALVNPGAAIPADVAALTGITDAMVSRAPPVSRVLPVFLAFASGCMLAAHNAPFDVGFLTAACAASGLPWPAVPVLDTAVLARAVLGQDEVPDCRLATLASFFGAPTLPCHRALPDAKATADVLQGLLGRLTTDGAGALAISA
jgi:DNA polymerase III subunit epsilon